MELTKNFSNKENFSDHNNLKNDIYSIINKITQHKQLLLINKINGDIKESIIDILKDCHNLKILLIEHDKNSLHLGENKYNTHNNKILEDKLTFLDEKIILLNQKSNNLNEKILKLKTWKNRMKITAATTFTIIVFLYEMGMLKFF